MEALTDSIHTEGILSPLIVRPLEGTDGYEVISGHRRLHAAQKAGLSEVPALVYEISREEAAIMLVDSNLHREHILPSEKAFAYKLKMEAMKHQGSTSPQVGEKLVTAEKVGADGGDSKNQVLRYVRLTHLIPELLQLVDDGKIALTPAVELSYLPEKAQTYLLEEIRRNDRAPHEEAVPDRKPIPRGHFHYHAGGEGQPAGKSQLQDWRPSKILPQKLQRSPDAGDDSEAAHRISAQATACCGKMTRGWTYGVSR